MKQGKEKTKKRMLLIIELVVIILLLVLIVYQYKEYESDKYIQTQYKTFNEEQKKCKIVGKTNKYIIIYRYDQEATPINGAKWKVTSADNKNVYTFETDKDGQGGIVGIKNGEYYLEEIEVPDGKTKKEYKYKCTVNDEDNSYSSKISDVEGRGYFLLVVKDNDGNPINGIEYDFCYNNGEIMKTITTNYKGLAGLLNVPSVEEYYVQRARMKDSEKTPVHIEENEITRIDLKYEEENN